MQTSAFIAISMLLGFCWNQVDSLSSPSNTVYEPFSTSSIEIPSTVPTRPLCAQSTTLSFCLDDTTYPSDDIQKEINLNYGLFYKMYAEVANQSATSLVDGISSDQESKYDYAFYYGNIRNTQSYLRKNDYGFRGDYYKEGGYICPAFINYSALYQATNARGEWQYVVNVKPWSQTVRIEQCFYPKAPCSYVTKAISSQCVQKYSFQRLVAYEPQGRGIYTDVFRLPTACSCHVRPQRNPYTRNRMVSTGPQMQGDATQQIDSRTGFPDGNSPNTAFAGPVQVPFQTPSARMNTNNWLANQNSQRPPEADGSISQETSSPQDSRLVERRRIRPEGLSLSEITNDREVDPSEFGFADSNQPYRGPEHPSPNNYQPPNQFRGPAGPPMQPQGDGSRNNPAFANVPNGYVDQDQRPRPAGWNNGPPAAASHDGRSNYQQAGGGGGYYDYNQAQYATGVPNNEYNINNNNGAMSSGQLQPF